MSVYRPAPWVRSLYRLKQLSLFLGLLSSLPAGADLYERLDELPNHLRSGGIPRDGIPAMTNPRAVPPDSALYLLDTDRIVGVLINGQARAYPHRLGWKHEVINDTLGGMPLAFSLCPLTGSALVFDARTPDGDQRTFGVSGVLLNSNLVLYDRNEEDALYPQMVHAAISGKRRGERLVLLPAIETSWQLWKMLHPHTTVAQASSGLDRYPSYIQALYPQETYNTYPYGDYRTNQERIMFHPSTADPGSALPAKEWVLGLHHHRQQKAYSLARLPNRAVINDVLGDLAILIVYDKPHTTGVAFNRSLDGQVLEFECSPQRGDLPLHMRDRQTHSIWDMAGRAVDGPLKGRSLRLLASHNAMYFAWSAHWPESALWAGEGLLSTAKD